jgi:ABC-type multidrug transport system fused ATPase/permease subunit
MFLKNLRTLYAILKSEASLAEELKTLRSMAARTAWWLLLYEIITLSQMYPIRWFFDGLSGGITPHKLYLLILLIVGGEMLMIQAVKWMDSSRINLFHFFWQLLWSFNKKVELSLDVAWHISHSTGEKEAILNKNISKIQNLVDNFLFDVIPIILRITITCSWLFYLYPPAGLIALVTILSFCVLVVINERSIAPLRRDFFAKLREIDKSGSEITARWRAIKQLGMENEFVRANKELMMSHFHEEAWRHPLYLTYIQRQSRLIAVSRGVLYLALGTAFVSRSISGIGLIALAINWMERSYSNFGRISQFQRYLHEGGEALRELIALYQVRPSIRQPETPRWPKPLRGKISFVDVSFEYPNGKKALSNVTFTADPNQTVAIIGNTGGGKSTIARLAAREFDPNCGTILLDGIPLPEIDYNQLRRSGVAVVSQDFELFDCSVRQNIRLGNPSAPEGSEIEAAKAACCLEFISSLPNGFDTIIGEDGICLSGGQRQRIAIARALIKQPRILILDEATSALDAASQEEIRQTIDQLIAARTCTILVIAHRFSTIMSADKVVVMENGTVSAIGSHEELLRGNGLYNRLRALELCGQISQ